MSARSLEVSGTVCPDSTLELNEMLNVPPGKVRVRVEQLAPAEAPPEEGMVEYIDRVCQERQAAGHAFRTKEEIDAEMEELRNEWLEDHNRVRG